VKGAIHARLGSRRGDIIVLFPVAALLMLQGRILNPKVLKTLLLDPISG